MYTHKFLYVLIHICLYMLMFPFPIHTLRSWRFIPPVVFIINVLEKAHLFLIFWWKTLPLIRLASRYYSLHINIYFIIHETVARSVRTEKWAANDEKPTFCACVRKLFYKYFRYLIIIEKWLRETFYRRSC